MELVDLNNRKILVTGASSGIGREVSILLSKLGASVVLCGRNQDRLCETISLMENPEKHRSYSFDISNNQECEEIFQDVVLDGSKLNGLVHCAGIARAVPLRVMKYKDILEMFETNYMSFMKLTQLYAKKKYSDGGSIVAVSAANAHYPQKCMSIYAASKAALEASVKSLAIELTAQNIRINCVIPGAINTSMMSEMSESERKLVGDKQLLGVGKPEDVANMIAFLLSDASSFVTGRSMYVDGGLLGQ